MAKGAIDKTRGERIHYVRVELLDLRSQLAFAEWLGGVTRGAVGNWERGEPIGFENLSAIADKAGISLEWLASNKGPKPVKDAARRSNRLHKAISDYEELSAAEKAEFFQYIAGLRDAAQTESPSPGQHQLTDVKS